MQGIPTLVSQTRFSWASWCSTSHLCSKKSTCAWFTNCTNIVRIECLDWKEKRKLSTLQLPNSNFPHYERSRKEKPLNPSWLTKLQDICFVNGREKSPLSSNPWVSILGIDKEKDQATFWMATNRWLQPHILSFFKISYFWIDECLVCLTQNSIKLCAKLVTKENVIGIQLVQSSIQNLLPICTCWCAKLILKENTLGTYRVIGCHENQSFFLLFAFQNIYK
jgi:hypothetical protein